MKATLRSLSATILSLALASSAWAFPGGGPVLGGPTSTIISPANGAVFEAPVNITIEAMVTPHGSPKAPNTVKSAEFFANGQSLGLGTLGFCVCQIEFPGGLRPLVPSRFVWSNAPPGVYALTCKATDSNGVSVISAPVNITVNPVPPTPTNLIPFVSIVATDPIAIATTNCRTWLGLSNFPPAWSNWIAANALFRTFTNCGPKDATFAVHRFGATNNDLTLTYNIGGNALNGADYVELPGFITIPAGQSSAFVLIEPLDTGATNSVKTVVLSIPPDTNNPPVYVAGFQTRAEALIIDLPGLGHPFDLLADHTFHLNASGPDAAWFHIEYSTDMHNWTPLCTNQLVNGSIDFVDPNATNDVQRFYRAVPEPNPPQ